MKNVRHITIPTIVLVLLSPIQRHCKKMTITGRCITMKVSSTLWSQHWYYLPQVTYHTNAKGDPIVMKPLFCIPVPVVGCLAAASILNYSHYYRGQAALTRIKTISYIMGLIYLLLIILNHCWPINANINNLKSIR